MSVAKITISIDEELLSRVDRLIAKHVFQSRSGAIQRAIEEKIARIDRARFARECAKLNPSEEQPLAEEGFSSEAAEWPEY